jgi:hypothetical protein
LTRFGYWGLTLGTVLRYAAETTLGYTISTTWLRYAILAGMVLQSLALLACCLVVWPRIRAERP